MLRFFRHIRKTLMEHPSKGRTGNKVRTYLFYAVGEIVLVMIGILLALQVNNWNEERKERQEELVVLSQLKTGFESNRDQLAQKIEVREGQLNAVMEIYNMIDKPVSRQLFTFDSLLTTTVPATTFDPYNNDLSNVENLKLIQSSKLQFLLSSWTSDLIQVTEEEINWKTHREMHYIPFIIENYQLRTATNQSFQRNFPQDFLIENNLVTPPEFGSSNHDPDINKILDHPDFEDHLTRAYTVIYMANLQSNILQKKIDEILLEIESELSN